jgi:hypothetical protein
MTEGVTEQHLIKLLKYFDNPIYLDYIVKVCRICSYWKDTVDIAIIESYDSVGDIGFRAKFSFPVFILLSHPLCRIRSHKDYPLRESFFITNLGLILVFFSSLNQMTIMKLYGHLASDFFNPSSEPLEPQDPQQGVICWEFPVSSRPVEYSSMNFIELNDSQPRDAGPYMTAIFDKYFRLLYWSFPRKGFSLSTHFLYTRDRISSFVKVAKSIYLIEKIGNPHFMLIEGKYVETRKVYMKGLNVNSAGYSFDTFDALMDADAANEIMLRSNSEQLFVNGIVTELRQSGGIRNEIMTVIADYVLSTYDIIQALIGIVVSIRYTNSSKPFDVGDINDIREEVANILVDIKKDIIVPPTISDSVNHLFEICLTQMFPLVVIDSMPPNIISCNYKDVLTGRVHVFDLTNLC